jgi:hypothetical protein
LISPETLRYSISAFALATKSRSALYSFRWRKPRVGRNPKTGERVEVPAKKIPFFKPSKELKDLVNTGGGQAPAPPAPPATPTPA